MEIDVKKIERINFKCRVISIIKSLDYGINNPLVPDILWRLEEELKKEQEENEISKN